MLAQSKNLLATTSYLWNIHISWLVGEWLLAVSRWNWSQRGCCTIANRLLQSRIVCGKRCREDVSTNQIWKTQFSLQTINNKKSKSCAISPKPTHFKKALLITESYWFFPSNWWLLGVTNWSPVCVTGALGSCMSLLDYFKWDHSYLTVAGGFVSFTDRKATIALKPKSIWLS